MKKKLLFKIIKDTRLFKKGQKVWGIYSTGALAAKVTGRFRGKGEWIKAWVHWEDPDLKGTGRSFSGKADCKYLGEVEISDAFYNYLEIYS